MARKPVFDDCMLCGECPCVCKKVVKKVTKKAATKKAPAAPKVVEETPEPAPEPAPVVTTPVDVPRAPRPDPRATMRAQAGRSRTVPAPAPAASAPKQTNQIIKHVPQTTGDIVIDDAIRLLGSILHPEEKARYADLLWSERSHAVRALRWRQRREEVLGAHNMA